VLSSVKLLARTDTSAKLHGLTVYLVVVVASNDESRVGAWSTQSLVFVRDRNIGDVILDITRLKGAVAFEKKTDMILVDQRETIIKFTPVCSRRY
jgi:hypothetical protein